MRIAPAITLSPEQRATLEQRARSRSLPARVVERARMVLLIAEGRQDKDVAGVMKITPKKVSRWRKRFLTLGMAGLERDAPRPGRTPKIGAPLIRRVVNMTTRQKPPNATHWSTRSMAAAVGISEASVRRIWHSHGLKTASHRELQGQQRSGVRGKTGRYRRLVSEPARTRSGAVRGREKSDPSFGSYPTRTAAQAWAQPDHDTRLQTQRHGYSFRRPQCGQRRGVRVLSGTPSSPGMAQVSAPARSSYAAASRLTPDCR